MVGIATIAGILVFGGVTSITWFVGMLVGLAVGVVMVALSRYARGVRWER